MRLTLRLISLVLTLVGALAIHGLWRLLRLPSPWPRLFLGGVARIVGAHVRVVGTPLRRDVVFVANHLSWIDILLIAGQTGSAFVAKAELRGVPLVGWLCTLNRTLFVTREDRAAIGDQIAALRAALADGWPVTLFPEGTTGDGTSLLPFKAALFAALDPPPPGVRVQPVRIDYGDATEELAWVGDEHGADHAKRVLRRRGTFSPTLHFCEAFGPGEVGGRKAIAAEARARIEGADLSIVSAPLTDAELTARRPVWTVLSNLFLDTDVALCRDHDAGMLAESSYSLNQIERILTDEVTPVCGPNLHSLAGEWAGFDDAWLEARICDRRATGRPGWRMRIMWPDWLRLRDAALRLRREAGDPAADAVRRAP